MQTILVVDDNQDVLDPVCEFLRKCGRGYRVVAATSGRQCMELLDSQCVDLILSDLRMADGDGIDILADVSRRSPPIPVIVMSGYVPTTASQSLIQLGRLRVLQKPVSMPVILQTIEEVLSNATGMGILEGFSLAGILQLVEMEEKTCLVEVRGRHHREGCFVFVEGKLQRALVGDLTGEDAALELLTWDHPKVRVRQLPDAGSQPHEIGSDVTSLLMRSLQIRDEANSGLLPDDTGGIPSPAGTDNGNGGDLFFSADVVAAATATAQRTRAQTYAAPAQDEPRLRVRKTGGAAPPLPPPPPPPPSARPVAGPAPAPTRETFSRRSDVEDISSWPQYVAFLGVCAVLIGFQIASPSLPEALGPVYGWTRTLLVAAVYVLVVADAFSNSYSQALLCLLIPPYLLYYVSSRVSSYVLRGVFFGLIAAIVAEMFLYRDQALLLIIAEGMQRIIGFFDQLIVRAGKGPI